MEAGRRARELAMSMPCPDAHAPCLRQLQQLLLLSVGRTWWFLFLANSNANTVQMGCAPCGCSCRCLDRLVSEVRPQRQEEGAVVTTQEPANEIIEAGFRCAVIEWCLDQRLREHQDIPKNIGLNRSELLLEQIHENKHQSFKNPIGIQPAVLKPDEQEQQVLRGPAIAPRRHTSGEREESIN